LKTTKTFARQALRANELLLNIWIHLTEALTLLGISISIALFPVGSPLHLWERSVPTRWLMIGPDGENRQEWVKWLKQAIGINSPKIAS
jgi:hypothetical protein